MRAAALEKKIPTTYLGVARAKSCVSPEMRPCDKPLGIVWDALSNRRGLYYYLAVGTRSFTDKPNDTPQICVLLSEAVKGKGERQTEAKGIFVVDSIAQRMNER